MRVDDTVQDEVEREVDGLERVGDGHGEVVCVDVEAIADGNVAYEVHYFCRYHQREVHGDDDDQCQCDAVSGTAVAVAARTSTGTTSGRLAHAQRAAQLGDEVNITEHEEREGSHDADDEVGPLVDVLDALVNCQPADVHVVVVAALEAWNGCDLVTEKPRNVGKDADGEDAS